MNKTLITAYEVVRFAPVDSNYATAYICVHLSRIERTLFNKCYLGLGFYSDLLLDLYDYSNVAEFENKIYNLGDLIVYDGCVLKSIIDNNNDHPADSLNWVVGDKFKTSCNQILWDNYLKYYLAFSVIHDTIIYSTTPATAKGLIRHQTDDTSSATPRDLHMFRSTLKNDAIDTLELMEMFIETGDCKFNIKKKDCDNCVKGSQRRNTRFNFKT